MKCKRSPWRAKLNQARVWELLDQRQMSQDQLARLCGIAPEHTPLLMRRSTSHLSPE